MKYEPPKYKAYESNLTAKGLYDIVSKLIGEHVTEDFSSEAPSVEGVKKLDHHPKIREELEEFIESYLFGGFLPEVGGLFKAEGIKPKYLEDYIDRLKQERNSKDKAIHKTANLFIELSSRFKKFSDELKNLSDIKGEETIKVNSKAIFSDILGCYSAKFQSYYQYLQNEIIGISTSKDIGIYVISDETEHYIKRLMKLGYQNIFAQTIAGINEILKKYGEKTAEQDVKIGVVVVDTNMSNYGTIESFVDKFLSTEGFRPEILKVVDNNKSLKGINKPVKLEEFELKIMAALARYEKKLKN